MAGRRGVLTLAAAGLVAAGSLAGGCSANPAEDFCSGYADAVHQIVVAAQRYEADPAAFDSTFESVMDGLKQVRTKAPDETLRAAFDRSMFTFSVFDSHQALADFIGRADLSANAVVVACAEYGVDVRL